MQTSLNMYFRNMDKNKKLGFRINAVYISSSPVKLYIGAQQYFYTCS